MAKRSSPRAYVDSCCFIDMAKSALGQKMESDPEREVAFLKLMFEAARDGEIDLYTSTISVVECLHADNDMTDDAKSLFRALLTSGQYVKLITPDPFVAEAARDLRWVSGINIPKRSVDYLHIASALEVNCGELVTLDKGILEHATKLKIKGLTPTYPSGTEFLTDERKQVDWLKANVRSIAETKSRKNRKSAADSARSSEA